MSVVVGYGQTGLDIAIQEYGSAEGIIALMLDNPTVMKNPKTILAPGAKLKIKSAPVNDSVLQYYVQNNLKPASWGGEYLQENYLLNEDYLIVRNESYVGIIVPPEPLLDGEGHPIGNEDDDSIEN